MAEIDWSQQRATALGKFTLSTLPARMKLPALPHAVTMFSQKSNDENCSLKDLSAIIETDTGLTVELLRFVNSAYMGLRHQARNVQQALSLLGRRQSTMFIIQTGMQAAVQAKKSKLINQSCFWNASLQKALFAKEVARLLNSDGDLAFAGSLLQDYLLPVITNDLYEQYIDFIQDRSKQPESMCDYERNRFGWDHALAAACLAHRWNLPDDLVCCILFHHYGLKILVHEELRRSAVAAVALSALLPDQLRQNYHGLEQLLKLQEIWPAFDLQELANRVDETQAEMGLGVRNDFPLARRCRPVLDEATFKDGSVKTSAVA